MSWLGPVKLARRVSPAAGWILTRGAGTRPGQARPWAPRPVRDGHSGGSWPKFTFIPQAMSSPMDSMVVSYIVWIPGALEAEGFE
ncbi:hypothetical protein TCAL_11139 [Tigriopus californicus]|uniref:Uncharacterized protein n=1 Tax=Tigriopus californicus TaxID=6832 RepID=A0A553NPE6_TIGCA|nr:hypothetical protein TCAL_11139 [Tigriopus californicus]